MITLKFRLSDGKAMLASALQSVRNFDHRSKRYLLTLVALLALTAGAWAEDSWHSSQSQESNTVTLTNITVTFNGDWTFTNDLAKGNSNGQTITIAPTAAGDFTLIFGANIPTSKSFNMKDADNNELTGKKYSDPSVSVIGSGVVIPSGDGVIYALEAGKTYTFFVGGATWSLTSFTFEVKPAGPEVTYNDAKTTASFEMPSYDATVSYQLVRDLAQGVAFSGLPEGDGCILKKDGDKYTFATAPEITLVDGIDPENPQSIATDGITLSVYPMVEVEGKWKADEDATPVALADFLASPQPGNWTIKAVAAEPSAYDGTFYSKKFTLAEAYDLTLSPATDAHLKSVTVAGTAKTADEKGVIKNIEPTKKVKITTTGPDYIIRKAAVKKTPKTITIGDVTLIIEGCTTWQDIVNLNSDKIGFDGSGDVWRLSDHTNLLWGNGWNYVNKSRPYNPNDGYHWDEGDIGE